MTFITADNLSLHFPVSRQGSFSGPRRPQNLISVGRKRYIRALQDLTFEILNGQRVGIIGVNGSGKSSLLRVLGRIYAPTSGSMSSQGRISSLFNINLGTHAEVSGRDNIVIRGLIKGWSNRKIKELLPNIIEFSELGDFIDLPLRTYSDGMRMRLLFAIATAFSPEILLLDEWIGAGDAKFQRKAAKRMQGLVKDSGITVLASHNRKLVLDVCDFGIWLHEGKIRASGEITQVYNEMDQYLKTLPA